ncbi:MAG: sialate O-acetylesterase [Verrucomicrobia bacterium]|nr:sialate O-acetylesterase [Verrucomicrobiota bacterium]
MKRILSIVVVLMMACLPARLNAAKLHGLFTDNMVLQRDRPVAVYGTGDDGEKVTVELNGRKATATVANGQWKVALPAMKAGGPHTMKINAVTLKNILVGDVWLCTGQSNMAGVLKSYKGDGYKEYQHLYTGIPKANPKIRLFKLKQDGADTPQRDVVTDESFGAVWRLCDEESAMEFSATGYLFGSKLQPEIGVPVGLIYATLGGTPAESWMSADTLRSRPEFKDILDGYETAKANYPKAYEQFQKNLAEWKTKKPSERGKARAPQPPMGPQHPKRPSGLFNFMIAPLQQFVVKGAIWYQGEGNSSRAVQYRTLFPALITSWRQQWGLGDFPFLFVQLAAYHKYNPETEDTGWAWLREAQTMTLSLPNTGMAVAIDVGHQTNIHPPDKPTVGARLAASALKVAYGRDIVAAGPMFKRMTIKGGQAALEFDNVGGGLITKAVETDGHSVPASPLKGFSICGADKKFYWANAVIQGKQVIVSSPKVAAPVAVRYAWADFPLCNLYNKEGFPAVPFRTDKFEMNDAGKVTGIGVGKPSVCNQPITNGLYGGLTDGDLGDTSKTAWATSGAMKFPKHVTVDLKGKYNVTDIRVHNSGLGGTKTVEVQVSQDGKEFKTLGKTEFKNYTKDVFELTSLTARGVTHVRLFFPDVHEISFQRKANGFIFLRELEIQGAPAQ